MIAIKRKEIIKKISRWKNFTPNWGCCSVPNYYCTQSKKKKKNWIRSDSLSFHEIINRLLLSKQSINEWGEIFHRKTRKDTCFFLFFVKIELNGDKKLKTYCCLFLSLNHTELIVVFRHECKNINQIKQNNHLGWCYKKGEKRRNNSVWRFH